MSHSSDFLGKWTRFTFGEDFVQGDESDDLTHGDQYNLRLGFGGGMVAVTMLIDDYYGRNDALEEDDSGFVILALGDFEGGTGNTPLTARQHSVSIEEFPYEDGKPVPARTLTSTGGLYFLSLEDEDPAVYALSKLTFSGSSFSFSKNFTTFESESLASDSGRVRAVQPVTTNRLVHEDEFGAPGFVGKELLPDHRQIRDVVVRDGFLWAVHEGIDEGGEVVRTHWLSMRLNTPRAIVQSGRIGGGSNAVSCIGPSIAVNANFDVLVGFTATGAHDFPSAAYAFRYGSDAAGTMRGIRFYVSGTQNYVNPSHYSNLTFWPGFTSTRSDPADDSALWTSQSMMTDYLLSQMAQVTGNAPPVITQHPANRTVAPNASTTFTVAATGNGLQYQWFHEDAELGFGHAATVNVASANASTAGYYKCRVKNAGGEVWSNAALLKLTTGNPGVFSFVDAADNDLDSLTWNERGVVFQGIEFPYRTLTVRRRNGTDGRVRVAVDVKGRFAPPAFTATAGWDYTAIQTSAPNSLYFSGPGALTFENGEVEKSLSVYIRPDTMVEPSLETMEATLEVDPSRGAVAGTPSLPISLIEDDLAPTFAQAVDYNIAWTNEGNRWKPQTSVTSDGVDAVQSDASAPGSDETAFSGTFSGDGTLVFRWRTSGDAGDRLRLVRRARGGGVVAAEIPGGSPWQTAAVEIHEQAIGDTTAEWRFLRGAQSGNALAGGFVDQIRFDAGTGGVVEFAEPSWSVEEGAGSVSVTIVRHGHTTSAGTVGVTLQNITATGGSDYQSLAIGLFSFAAGQTSRTVSFTIFPDQIPEPVETFRAVLSEQGAGTIGIGPVSSTIISIVDQPGETYATWAPTKFSAAQMNDAAISGKLADPDKDGVPNVLEYAFDGQPLSPLSAPQPASTVESVPGESLQRHALTFLRRRQALDLTYIVQRTADLTTWQDGATLTPMGNSSIPAIVQLVSATGNPIETRTVRDGAPITPGQRSWLRLKVLCP